MPAVPPGSAAPIARQPRAPPCTGAKPGAGGKRAPEGLCPDTSATIPGARPGTEPAAAPRLSTPKSRPARPEPPARSRQGRQRGLTLRPLPPPPLFQPALSGTASSSPPPPPLFSSSLPPPPQPPDKGTGVVAAARQQRRGGKVGDSRRSSAGPDCFSSSFS